MKTFFYNLITFLILILIGELIFGYWFTKDNFGIYMKDERDKNWKTTSTFDGKKYNFFYKRNFYGFRGEEFDPKNVKIVFEGGSTGNQRFTPENYTIVGQLNEKFMTENIDIKIYNASTDGKTLRGIIYDFIHWFPKIKDLKPKYLIFYLGINERVLADQTDEFEHDLRMKKKKFNKLKDYVKNNSFIIRKYTTIKNKYFPKNTSGYFFDSKKLYDDFSYVNYSKAINVHHEPGEEDYKLLIQLEKRLLTLKNIAKSNKFEPVIITQVAYNGLKDQRLFFINEKIKEFSKNNNYQLINLDEIIEMGLNDFYDEVHTTPKGSKKIADAIYPYLKKILIN
tara:strand:- start:1401 stop:2414 length:1014 start_codon:yes stop_codon:yes gene_type:complete